MLAVAGVILPACSSAEHSSTPTTPTSVIGPSTPITAKTFAGTVTDLADVPISGAVVSTFNRYPRVITDEMGHFALSADSSIVSFPISASKDGYVTRTETLYVDASQPITIRLPQSLWLQLDELTTSELLPTDPPAYVGEPYDSDYFWNTKFFSLVGPLANDVIVEISWDMTEGDLAMTAREGVISSTRSGAGAIVRLPRGTTGALIVGRPFVAGKLSRPVAFTIAAHRDGPQ